MNFINKVHEKTNYFSDKKFQGKVNLNVVKLDITMVF